MLSYLQLLCSILSLAPAPNSIALTVENISSSDGTIMVALFADGTDFPSADNSIWRQAFPLSNDRTLSITIPDLPTGQYAVAVFHDVNDNRKLDKSWLGIPQEPYGFSGGATAKWSAPNFKEAVFTYDGNQQDVVVTLRQWSDQ